MVVLQIEATFGAGSTGNIVLDIHKQIKDNGFEAYVASPIIRSDLISSPYVYRIGSWLDHKLHALLSRLYGKQAYFSRTATYKLIRHIKQINPDIIHLHDLHSNYINLNVLLKYIASTDIKLVLTLHDCWFFTGGCFHFHSIGCEGWKSNCGGCPKRLSDTPAYLGDKSSKILKDRIRYFGAIKDLTVVGVSDWIVDQYKQSRINPRRVLTIHNGVDLNIFKPVISDFKKRHGIENKHVILGPASKWLQEINKATLDYFIENITSDCVFVLLGCNSENIIESDKVIQIPFTTDKRNLIELYSSADVFVNCSREDSLPLINLEAQACGTPVITYADTGLKETVNEIHSHSVPTGDYRMMFESAMNIIYNKNTYESNSSELINWIEDNFNKDTCIKSYLDLYKKILTED